MRSLETLSGETFGNLFTHNWYCVREKKIYWLCTCKCGSLVFVQASDLKSGEVISCGCVSVKRKRKNLPMLPAKATLKLQSEEIDAITE